MANLSSFDLNLLRVLDALLTDPSTVRAADRLGLSQPAVSAALGRLRGALGDELFFRRGAGLAPTDYALSLQNDLRDTLTRIEALIQGPDSFDPATSDARFRISGSDFFAELLMPRLAAHLQTIAPGLRVHLVDLVPDSYVTTLDRYDVDLAIVPQTDLPDWVDARPVFRSGFSVVARADHPAVKAAKLSPNDTLPLDQFCALGHVLFSPEGKSAGMGDAALAKVGRERRVVMTMPTFSGVYRAVAGSDHIALLPTALAHHIADDAGLIVLTAPFPVPTAQLLMIWNRRFTQTAAHLWLRDQIAQMLAPLDMG